MDANSKRVNFQLDWRKAAQLLKSWRNGDANLIDLLLVVYPSAVRSEAGSTAAVEAAIASGGGLHLCYRSSLVPMQLRVVHMAEVAYTPTGILNTDLSRLQNPSDGSMDNAYPPGSVRGRSGQPADHHE